MSRLVRKHARPSALFLCAALFPLTVAAAPVVSCDYPTRVFEPVVADEGGQVPGLDGSMGDDAPNVEPAETSTPGDAVAEVSPGFPPDAPVGSERHCGTGVTFEQVFGPHVFGCVDVARANPSVGGTTWVNRAALCASACRVCAAQDWLAVQKSGVPLLVKRPQDNFWLDENLASASAAATPFACAAVASDAGAPAAGCPDAPMRVCKHTPATDPRIVDRSGDSCLLHDCGFGADMSDLYFGGCGTTASDTFAGTLCCCP